MILQQKALKVFTRRHCTRTCLSLAIDTRYRKSCNLIRIGNNWQRIRACFINAYEYSNINFLTVYKMTLDMTTYHWLILLDENNMRLFVVLTTLCKPEVPLKLIFIANASSLISSTVKPHILHTRVVSDDYQVAHCNCDPPGSLLSCFTAVCACVYMCARAWEENDAYSVSTAGHHGGVYTENSVCIEFSSLSARGVSNKLSIDRTDSFWGKLS